MTYANILVEVKDGIATLTLNRASSLNSLNMAIMEDIRAALRTLAKDDSVKTLIVTGAGRGFCAGADLTSTGGGDSGGRSVGEGRSRSVASGANRCRARAHRAGLQAG